MILNTIIITVILVAFVMMALGIKMLFDKNAEFNIHSCFLEHGDINDERTCYQCQIKNSEECPEK